MQECRNAGLEPMQECSNAAMQHRLGTSALPLLLHVACIPTLFGSLCSLSAGSAGAAVVLWRERANPPTRTALHLHIPHLHSLKALYAAVREGYAEQSAPFSSSPSHLPTRTCVSPPLTMWSFVVRGQC